MIGFLDDDEVHTDYDGVDEVDGASEDHVVEAPGIRNRARRHNFETIVGKSAIDKVEAATAAATRNLRRSYFSVDGDAQQYSSLNETIYTILYMSKPSSAAFRFAFGTFLMQLALVVLVLFDTLDLSRGSENPLSVPPNVGTAVHWAQGMIVFLMVAFQQDFIEAATKWHNGPNHEFIRDVNTGATMASFHGSTLAQLVTGCTLLSAIFILTMQATSVVSMMLNFAALHFLSELDDLAFRFAKEGMFRTVIEDEIHRIMSYKVLDRSRCKDKAWLRAVVCFVAAVLFGSWGWLKYQQVRGTWLCDRVYVEFGDAFNPQLAQFSGIYSRQDSFTFETRDYADDLTGNLTLLAYCEDEQRWTFSYMDNIEIKNEEPCKRKFAQSPRTTSFNVMDTAESGWSVLVSETQSFVPFDHFALICADDDKGVELSEQSGLLNFFSDDSPPCDELQIDGRTESFPRIFNLGPIARKFYIWKYDNDTLHTEYGFPVYYSDTVSPYNYIFFTGRRWALIHGYSIESNGWDISDNWDLVLHESVIANHTFQRHFLGRNLLWDPLFMSDPVDYSSSSFQPAPVGLNWYPVTKGYEGDHGGLYYGPDFQQAPLSTRLLCVHCEQGYNDVCLPHGECNANNRCDCDEHHTSGTCEQNIACFDQLEPCGGHGLCDPVNGQCRCDPGWYGQICEAPFYCFEDGARDCVHNSTCSLRGQRRGHCVCNDPSVYGDNCEIWSNCTASGCSNGGSCMGETRKCSCLAGFSGQFCDIMEESSCEQSLCRDGTTCSFFEPTGGSACVAFGDASPDCSQGADVCENNGVCSVSSDFGSTCFCEDPATSGNFCEEKVHCSVGECSNGGSCNELTGVCACTEGFSGSLCDFVESCDLSLCRDGTKCSYFGFNNSLACVPFIYIEVDDAYCSEDLFFHDCECRDPAILGDFCDEWIDCSAAECSNGGSCDPETGKCTCPAGFAGILCDILEEESSCETSLCRNGTECSVSHGLGSITACVPLLADATN